MLPDQTLSLTVVPGTFLAPDNFDPLPLEDRELGGIALNDPSEGIQYQVWEAYIESDYIVLDPANGAPIPMLNVPGCTALSFTFDQNMNVTIAYMQGTQAYLYWYDTSIPGYTTTNFPDAITPRVALDDKRQTQTSTSDVIFAYIRENNLYFRAQRDRYEVEYLLASSVDALLIQMGMSNRNRFQFKLRPIL